MALVFVLFVFLSLVFLGLTYLGIAYRHPSMIIIAGFFVLMTGAIILSDGLRDEGRPQFVKTGNTVVIQQYDVLLKESDFSVLVLGNGYFYGGIVEILLGSFLTLSAFRSGGRI